MANSVAYTQPYSEEHVSADLSEKAMLMIAMLCAQVEQNKSYGELIQTKDALSKFGFSNSQSAMLLEEMSPQMHLYAEATNTLAFMEEVWQKFGKEAMVVRYDHFFEILEKYDMVCGSFDRYTGAIPQDAIDTLNRLSEMWEQKQFDPRYGQQIDYIARTIIKDENDFETKAIKQLRMPMLVNDKEVARKIEAVIGSDDLTPYRDELSSDLKLPGITDALFIAAPAADMKPLKLQIKFATPEIAELKSHIWFHIGLRDHIIDQRNEELQKSIQKEEERLIEIVRSSGLNRYAKISFIKEEPIINRILRDPFICSLTPHGVLIHAKWGAEAEDATIKRYEELRDAVIGKGGAQCH